MSIFRRGNKIPDNSHAVTTIVYGPSPESVELAASMAIANSPASPMASGVHSNGGGFASAVQGYGVNRFGGKIPYAAQEFYSAVRTSAEPLNLRLGYGAGVSGQPGLPSTGQSGMVDQTLGLMSMSQTGSLGYGS